jgi:hypothetical protein
LGNHSLRPAYAFALSLFAIGLQILVTPTIAGTPLRLASADLILPVVLAFAFMQWLKAGRPVPPAPLRRVAMWMSALTLWLALSVAIGYGTIGRLEPWGLVNKFFGFFFLIGYFAAGYGLLCQSGEREIGAFLKTLLLTGWAIALFSLGSCVLYASGMTVDSEFMWRARGFSDNANAYGCLVTVLLVVEIAVAAKGLVFSRGWHLMGMTLLILALVFSGSRSAWLGAVAGFAVLVWLRFVNWRLTALAAIIATISIIPLSQGLPALITKFGQTQMAVSPAPRPLYLQEQNVVAQDSGVDHRMRMSHEALALWQTAPLQGVGLGAFLWHQKQSGAAEIAVIHTSALWLLTETGLIGLGLFLGFFAFSVRGLWRVQEHEPAMRSNLRVATISVLVAAAAASIGTEMLYQRHLWFLLGAAWVSVSLPKPLASRENSAV